jgi:hypothetical protein
MQLISLLNEFILLNTSNIFGYSFHFLGERVGVN